MKIYRTSYLLLMCGLALGAVPSIASAKQASVTVGDPSKTQAAQENTQWMLNEGATGLESNAVLVDETQKDLLACLGVASERLDRNARVSGEIACRVTASARTSAALKAGSDVLLDTAGRLKDYSQKLARQAILQERDVKQRESVVKTLKAEQENLRKDLLDLNNSLPDAGNLKPEQLDRLGEMRSAWDSKNVELEDEAYFLNQDRILVERYKKASADYLHGWAGFRASSRTFRREADRHDSYVKRQNAKANAIAVYASLNSTETNDALKRVLDAMAFYKNVDDPNLDSEQNPDMRLPQDQGADGCTFCGVSDQAVGDRAWLSQLVKGKAEVSAQAQQTLEGGGK